MSHVNYGVQNSFQDNRNFLFIINGESESYKETQYRIVGTMKDERLKLKCSTRLTYTGTHIVYYESKGSES
jgi:hypothetical protein